MEDQIETEEVVFISNTAGLYTAAGRENASRKLVRPSLVACVTQLLLIVAPTPEVSHHVADIRPPRPPITSIQPTPPDKVASAKLNDTRHRNLDAPHHIFDPPHLLRLVVVSPGAQHPAQPTHMPQRRAAHAL